MIEVDRQTLVFFACLGVVLIFGIIIGKSLSVNELVADIQEQMDENNIVFCQIDPMSFDVKDQNVSFSWGVIGDK